MKNYLIVLGSAFLLFVILLACVFNPHDKQYRSFYDETAADAAYKKHDIKSYLELMDNPTSVKYHTARMLVLSALYKNTGRFNDAIRVINSYEKEIDYSFCALYKEPVKKIGCRLAFTFPASSKNYDIDKNEKISQIYYAKGDYKKAEEYNSKAKKINYCYSARISANLNDLKKAETNLNECRLNKKEIAKTRGVIFLKEKKYAEAEKEYLSLIHKGCLKSPKCKGNNDIYILLGELYFVQGNYAKALSYFKKVLKQEPYTYKANYYAAQCELKLNKDAEALAYLKKMLSYNPDNKAEIESLIAKINSN